MSTVRISQLPTLAAVNGTDQLPIVQGGTTARASVAQIRAGLLDQTAGDARYLQRTGGSLSGNLHFSAPSGALTFGSGTMGLYYDGSSQTWYTNGPSQLLRFDTGNQPRLIIASAGDVHPGVDNATSLGTAARRWREVYAVNGVISTSDQRDKDGVAPADEAVALQLLKSVMPVTFTWKPGPPPEPGPEHGTDIGADMGADMGATTTPVPAADEPPAR